MKIHLINPAMPLSFLSNEYGAPMVLRKYSTPPLGLLTGWPAIRRRGLALALATFAVGVAVSRFVFGQPFFVSGLSLDRPAGLAADRAFYLFELVVLALVLLKAQKHALMDNKPIIVVNRKTEGKARFWDPLLALLKAHGAESMVSVTDTPEDAVKKLRGKHGR